MAITKEDILEAVGSLTVMELNDLVKAFEEKFGVSAAAVAVAGPAGAGAADDIQYLMSSYVPPHLSLTAT